jgi:hypothetical protein
MESNISSSRAARRLSTRETGELRPAEYFAGGRWLAGFKFLLSVALKVENCLSQKQAA